MNRSLVLLLCVALGAAIVGQSIPAQALDTGHHADITVTTMRESGFDQSAANVAQVENWLTDYYTSTKTTTIPSSGTCQLEKLHFDDLFTASAVANYWSTLTANTKTAVQQAVRANDPLQFLVVAGVSLHVVQDFYSHSNWNELYNTNGMYQNAAVPYMLHTASWFGVAQRPSNVFTGWYPNCLDLPQGNNVPHGGYYGVQPNNINPWPPQPPGTIALNHDSYVRPGWQGAYVFAYAASREWLDNLVIWANQVNPSFIATVKNYTLSASDAQALRYDQGASLYISEWVTNPLNYDMVDGHWKGNPSGYSAAFAGAFTAWTSNDNSVFVNQFVQGNPSKSEGPAYLTLSNNLYGSPEPQPSFSPAPTSRQWWILGMRTTSVAALYPGFFDTESYFATLQWAQPGFTWSYRDASQYHESNITPYWDDLLLIPSTTNPKTFALTYSITDEYSDPSKNTRVSLNGTATSLKFTCTLTSAAPTPSPDGSCSGDVNTRWDYDAGVPPVTVTGSGSNAVRASLLFSSSATLP